MPSRPPRACIQQGCKDVSHDGSNYCVKHKPKQSGWASYRAKNGNSRHKAGYGHSWDKLRKSILIRDRYLCQPCKKLGLFTEARQVDHKTPKAFGGTNDPTNLQAICIKCHKTKTQKESQAKKRLQNGA